TSATIQLAELRLDTPLLLAEQDRLLLRDISARQTLGAALVLDLFPPQRGKRRPERLAFWQHYHNVMSDDAKALSLRLTQGALAPDRFALARQLDRPTLAQLCQQQHVVTADNWLLSQTHAAALSQRLLDVLSDFHQQHPDQPGLSLSRLLRMALPAEPVSCAESLLRQLLETRQIHHRQGWLHLPTHRVSFNPEQQAVWQQVVPHLHTDTACWVRDLAHTCNLTENDMRTLLKSAAAQGKVTAIVPDRYCLQTHLLHCAELIRTQHTQQGHTSAADFRDQLGIGRKLAIQILEYFDRSGFTRRRANTHLLRDPRMFTRMDDAHTHSATPNNQHTNTTENITGGQETQITDTIQA
ncbi:MAG: SelB C-terminal domain-containing protein, partial [Plesiomonas sp.]